MALGASAISPHTGGLYKARWNTVPATAQRAWAIVADGRRILSDRAHPGTVTQCPARYYDRTQLMCLMESPCGDRLCRRVLHAMSTTIPFCILLASITLRTRRASTPPRVAPVTTLHTAWPGQEPLNLTWSIYRTTQYIPSMHTRHRCLLTVGDIQGRDILMRRRCTYSLTACGECIRLLRLGTLTVVLRGDIGGLTEQSSSRVLRGPPPMGGPNAVIVEGLYWHC